MWGAPTILEFAVPRFSGPCATLISVSPRPARCSPNVPTLAEVQPSCSAIMAGLSISPNHRPHTAAQTSAVTGVRGALTAAIAADRAAAGQADVIRRTPERGAPHDGEQPNIDPG